jgi:hypothetical protein
MNSGAFAMIQQALVFYRSLFACLPPRSACSLQVVQQQFAIGWLRAMFAAAEL